MRRRSFSFSQVINTGVSLSAPRPLLSGHPDKTRIVYCKDSNRRGEYPTIPFTFLGFTFRSRKALNRNRVHFTSFLPSVSNEAQKRMQQQNRRWRLPRQTSGTLRELSDEYNSILTGWWNYYGSFCSMAMHRAFRHFDQAFALWSRRKYKRQMRHRRRSRQQVNRRSQRRSISWERFRPILKERVLPRIRIVHNLYPVPIGMTQTGSRMV